MATGEDTKVTAHETAQESEYWRSFYEDTTFAEGSSFYAFVSAREETPGSILDIGCGDGRDSFAFASTGRRVLGLDRSEAGVERAREKSGSVESGLLAFSVCDVSDSAALSARIDDFRRQIDQSRICFYMRFFLHSIPESVQDDLIATVTEHSSSGDVLAAEFRTDKDEDRQHVFGDEHYRRYQNAQVFSQRLRNEYGWSIDFEIERTGLSPYKDEDPVLYRVLAGRP